MFWQDIHGQVRWLYKYKYQKEPYDEEAKAYLTMKALNLSQTRWEALDEAEREDLLSKELWIKENCEVSQLLLSC